MRDELYNERNEKESGISNGYLRRRGAGHDVSSRGGEDVRDGAVLKNGWDHRRFSNARLYMQLVQLAAHYYDNMRDLRKKWVRDTNYYMGRQLEDTVVYNGHRMTVRHYMEMKGMPALSCDIITDKMISLKGLVRNNYTAPSIESVDSDEEEYVNILNTFLRQNCNNNNKSEQDADQFENHSLLGFICDKVKWAFRQGREDVFVDPVDMFKLAVPVFSRKDLEDVEFIAEAHDVTWPQMLKTFVKEAGDEQKLVQIYTAARSTLPVQGYNDTGMNQTDHLDDFYHSSVVGKYRFIEVWTLERNRALWCHDRLNASAGYRPLEDKSAIDAENAERRQANIMKDENGVPLLDESGQPMTYVPEEELALIEYEVGIEELWYWRMLSPNGYLLDEGISPYKVLRDGYSFYYHPYVFLAYPCIQGEVRSFVDRLIDRQRQYNHDNIMLDFIIMNSAKGPLAIDEDALSDKMDVGDIAENWVKVDGVIIYTSKNGGNLPQQIMNKSLPAGIDLIMQRDRELVTTQSNVQPALQGASPAAGTSAARYRAEQQSSAVGVADYVSSFENFKLRVAKKQLWTIQCFYDDRRSVKMTGQDIRAFFNRETMGDLDCDIALTQDASNATVREALKDLAWQAYLRDEIDFGQCLDSANFGDTARLKRFWEEHKQEKQAMAMAQQQAAAALPAGGAAGMGMRTAANAAGTAAGAAHLTQGGGSESNADRDNGAIRLLQADGGGSPVASGTGGLSS